MELNKVIIRKYYKYQYEEWNQPVLTSNNSSNEIKLEPSSEYNSSYFAYKAFDNDDSTGWLTTDGVNSGTLTVTYIYTLKISSITVKGWSNPNGYTRIITICDSNDNVIGETHTYNGNGSYTWSFDQPIILNKLKFNVTGSSYWGCIGEIDINATKQYIIESTESDYDFYKDIITLNGFNIDNNLKGKKH